MKKNKIGILVGCFIGMTVLSGAITFMFFSKQNKEDQLQKEMANQMIKEKEEKKEQIPLKDLVGQTKEMYIKSFVGANYVIEVCDKESKDIIDKLTNLNLKLLMHAQNKVDDSQKHSDQKYLYGIDVKDKNVKININDKYIMIEKVGDTTQLFEADSNELKELKDTLQSIYMNQYSADKLFKDLKIIEIEAQDIQKAWTLESDQIQKILQAIHFIRPINQETLKEKAATYPNYSIHMKSASKGYTIELVNDHVLSLDTTDSYAYYEYDPKLWKYMNENYGVEEDESRKKLSYLLSASKIVVDDMEDEMDFEDDTYYHVEIPRWLIKASKRQVQALPENSKLMFVLTFTVNQEPVEVKIYEDYIVYENTIYYSEKIEDMIKSSLNA